MPERMTGIKGYVGEILVREWLKKKNSAQKYHVRSEIIPNNVDQRGGPYLDLCVIKNNQIIRVFEVKTQDYTLDDINKSLKYLWKMQKGKNGKYFGEQQKEYAYINDEIGKENIVFSKKVKSCLVLMCPPKPELRRACPFSC